MALVIPDALTERADGLFRRRPILPFISDFAEAEVASALARRVRTGLLDRDAALSAFDGFDHWVAKTTRRVQIVTGDVQAALGFVRRLDLPLRAPDAINIAIARRLGLSLATFDEGMARSAQALGVEVVAG